jgi:hypothetical protein
VIQLYSGKVRFRASLMMEKLSTTSPVMRADAILEWLVQNDIDNRLL